MKHKQITSQEAIKSCITVANLVPAIKSGWASIAVSLWGHDDPDKVLQKLENPLIKVVLDEDKKNILDVMTGKEIHSYEEAVLQLMIFELAKLGYHI